MCYILVDVQMKIATIQYEPSFWKRFLVGTVSLLVCDGLWLGVVARHYGLYAPHVYDKKLGLASMLFAVSLYAIISAAYSALIYPSTQTNALLIGAMSGFLVFSAFNITSVAINGKWNTRIALIDTTYGTIAWALMLFLQNRLV